MTQTIPSSSTLSTTTPATTPVVEASPAAYRRIAADLQQLGSSLPLAPLSADERNSLRRRGEYPKEAMYACSEMSADPAYAGRVVELPRETIDAKLLRVAEANRLARALRRLARQVSDDALVVQSGLATEAMQALDVLDVLASRPGGEQLRVRVDEARSMVRSDRWRAPRARKKKEQSAEAPVVAPKGLAIVPFR